MLQQPYACRFPGLNSINIKLQHAGEDGSLDPVLGLLHLHATALHCLCLQLVSSWEKHRMTWEALGKMDKLTKLQLSFGQKVCVSMVDTVHDFCNPCDLQCSMHGRARTQNTGRLL